MQLRLIKLGLRNRIINIIIYLKYDWMIYWYIAFIYLFYSNLIILSYLFYILY